MSTSHWTPARLGDLLKRRKQQIRVEDDRIYKRVTIRLGGQGVAVRDEVPGTEIGTKNQFIIQNGQFILSKIDALNGAFGVVGPSCDGAIITGNFWTFDVDRSVLNATFFNLVTKTPSFVDFCVRASSGTTNRRYLQETKFLKQEIRLPPLAEQERIVTRIERLLAKRDEAGLAAQQVTGQWRALLRSKFSQFVMNASRDKMGNVAPLVRRKVTPRYGEEYPELGIRSFGKGTFHKPPLDYLSVGSKKLYSIEPGDLVFNNVFAWEGAIAVSQPEDSGRVGSHRFITCAPKTGVADAEFLCFYFLTPEGLQRIGEASPGGAGRNRTLGLEKLAEIDVPIPDHNAQVKFTQLLRKVRAMQAIRRSAQSAFDAMLPSILDRAFKGAL